MDRHALAAADLTHAFVGFGLYADRIDGHVEGASHREVAHALGLAVASVRVLLFRARRRLAAQLGAAGSAR